MSENRDRRPPVFTSWGGWYRLVMAVAIAQLIVYFLITRQINIP